MVYKIIPVMQQRETLVNNKGVNTQTIMFGSKTDPPPIKLRPNLLAALNSDSALKDIVVVCQQETALWGLSWIISVFFSGQINRPVKVCVPRPIFCWMTKVRCC